MAEIFLPEIDCDTDNGGTIHSGFWQVVYTFRSHGRIMREAPGLQRDESGFNSPGATGN